MQETSFSVEILIHDDASTDGTDGIIREYADKYPEKIFPLFEEQNQYSQGVKVDFFNYNRARGKYIAYCEGDDYWTDPLKLQKQVDFMETHPEYSVCFHDFHCKDERLNKVVYPRNYSCLNNQEKGIDVTVDDYFHKRIVQPLTMLFRLSMFSFDWQKQYEYYRDTHEIYHLLRTGKGYWMNFDGGVHIKHYGGVSTSVDAIARCKEEREHVLELCLHNKDGELRKYLVEILLWNYDVYSNNNDVRSFWSVMRKFDTKILGVTLRVRYTIFKRKLKGRFKRS